MLLTTDTRRTIKNSVCEEYLWTWIEAFLIDRKANGLAEGSLYFYRTKLQKFADYCEAQSLTQISQVSPTFIRQFLLYLEENSHNPGGRHAIYRAIRAFFLWYQDEADPKDWSNPIRKVKAPRVPSEPIEPVSIESVTKMVNACERGTFTGDRDIAIMLCLLDTGARASEFLDINLADIDQAHGDILIRRGKGSKPRTVYIGKQSRRALRKYLSQRRDNCPALWVTHPRFDSERIKYDGLREILHRRSVEAKVEGPTAHDFRRAFALSMLRNGTDVFTLAKLMGHTGITVLQLYLKQTNQDTELAHRRAGPVDNSGL